MTYFLGLRPTKDRRGRAQAFSRFTLLKNRLAWTYLAESEDLGSFERCRETIEIAYKLGREHEDA